jgi:hypothetical protein
MAIYSREDIIFSAYIKANKIEKKAEFRKGIFYKSPDGSEKKREQIKSSLIPAPIGAGLFEDGIPSTLYFICCLKAAVFNVDKITKSDAYCGFVDGFEHHIHRYKGSNVYAEIEKQTDLPNLMHSIGLNETESRALGDDFKEILSEINSDYDTQYKLGRYCSPR